MINYIIKRDGTQVPFDSKRIKNAIFAAAQSVGGTDERVAEQLTSDVVGNLEKIGINRFINVEEIQDHVEKSLIENGHAKTAKSFILYRAKRSAYREEKRKEILKKIGRHEANIVLENGKTETFELQNLLQNISNSAQGLEKIDIEHLARDTCKNLFSGISVGELEKSLINTTRAKIEFHPQYSILAARFLFCSLYRKVLSITPQMDSFKKYYKLNFVNYIKVGIKDQLLDPKLKDMDLDKISESLIPERDFQLQYRGAQTLYDRYLLRRSNQEQQIFELPQYLWMRVAMGLSLAEKKEQRVERTIEFYHVISQLLYVPSTPTLFNAGTNHPQLSSCFLNTAPDSLEGIFKTYSDNAMLSKYAGGIGTDWTNVRSLGSRIKGTNGSSQGIIPFLKIFNDVAIAVNQGGKRKGAMAAYLEIWHGDIEEFLESKKNTGDERRRLHDVHTAVWINDLFMKRVRKDANWTLFSPTDVPQLHECYGMEFEKKYLEYEFANLPRARTVSALGLWRKTLTMLFETGHPWITFKDPINVRNPQSHQGVIHSSNLCTEITLNTSKDETAVCNLGSLNFSKLMAGDKIHEELLETTIKTAMRMLDNVIDVNFYPTVEAKNSNLKNRPVGLGLMGYQDALYMMGVPFASEEHLDFADQMMEKISYYAISASCEIAQEKGAYPSFKGSKWDKGVFPLDTLSILEKERGVPLQAVNKSKTMDWNALKAKVKKQGMRNSNCLAIAPTATISNISGTHPCIEPAFRNIYVKENTDGSFIVINDAMVEDLEKLNLWNQEMINKIKLNSGSLKLIFEIPKNIREKYEEAFEIPTEWLLKAAARRGKWIDQSQSLNLFLATSSGKILNNTYKLAWELGLKTTYYLRTLGATQVRTTVLAQEQNVSNPIKQEVEEKLEEAVTSEGKLCNLDDPDCEVCQ